jgi:hypothetical protein
VVSPGRPRGVPLLGPSAQGVETEEPPSVTRRAPNQAYRLGPHGPWRQGEPPHPLPSESGPAARARQVIGSSELLDHRRSRRLVELERRALLAPTVVPRLHDPSQLRRFPTPTGSTGGWRTAPRTSAPAKPRRWLGGPSWRVPTEAERESSRAGARGATAPPP